MISTVTTTTVTTVTSMALGATLGMIAILALLAFLLQKEILSAVDSPRAQAIGKALNVAIVPLLLSFVFIVVVKVVQVLN